MKWSCNGLLSWILSMWFLSFLFNLLIFFLDLSVAFFSPSGNELEKCCSWRSLLSFLFISFVSFLPNTTSFGFHLNDTCLCSLAFNFVQQKEDSYSEKKKKYICLGKPIIMIRNYLYFCFFNVVILIYCYGGNCLMKVSIEFCIFIYWNCMCSSSLYSL